MPLLAITLIWFLTFQCYRPNLLIWAPNNNEFLILKNEHPNFLEPKVFRYLVLFNQQFHTQRCSVYYHMMFSIFADVLFYRSVISQLFPTMQFRTHYMENIDSVQLLHFQSFNSKKLLQWPRVFKSVNRNKPTEHAKM